MTIIRLKGSLHIELTVIGLEEGDIILDAVIIPQDGEAAYFTKHHNGYPFECVVYPDNYEIVETSLKNQGKWKENQQL